MVLESSWSKVSTLKPSLGLHHSACYLAEDLVHGSDSAANLWGMEPDTPPLWPEYRSGFASFSLCG